MTPRTKNIWIFSAIGVNALGHRYPELDKAMQDQIVKLLHISNYSFLIGCKSAVPQTQLNFV